MNHSEIVDLIRGGVTDDSGANSGVNSLWADFGAGWGNFTRALRELLGDTATIYAVDRDEKAFEALRQNHGARGTLYTITADFTQPLDLPPLDGILMANALHFVAHQQRVLEQIRGYLKPDGRFILVEYDFKFPRPWVPHPIASEDFPLLMRVAGFRQPQFLATRQSPSSGVVMYSGIARS